MTSPIILLFVIIPSLTVSTYFHIFTFIIHYSYLTCSLISYNALFLYKVHNKSASYQRSLQVEALYLHILAHFVCQYMLSNHIVADKTITFLVDKLQLKLHSLNPWKECVGDYNIAYKYLLHSYWFYINSMQHLVKIYVTYFQDYLFL